MQLFPDHVGGLECDAHIPYYWDTMDFTGGDKMHFAYAVPF